MTESDIVHIVDDDEWMMSVLQVVQQLNLPDWWIGAGFIRNKVWDTLSGHIHRTALSDIDVLYFDRKKIDEVDEKKYEKQLTTFMTGEPWSVKNQARMGLIAPDGPYTSSADAISRWPETATCVAVTLNDKRKVQLFAPYGIADLVSLIVRPSPSFINRSERIIDRQRQKRWKEKWPRLQLMIPGYSD